ncbi:hypothetical protein KKF34_02125 [Myxococcota bacterium]|nr:hypothetical protein [Myxococcota bacterium]MBU1379816.1 hypothetical protein [Myxococcota bacterium]MBU1495658.1 hypothetical protein [Myxococcota bacterium]
MNQKELTHSSRLNGFLVKLMLFYGIIAFISILMFAVAGKSFNLFFRVSGVSLLIVTTALFSGALVGFLFGIPRTSSSESDQKDKYRVNTNLEQVSDWLTKIIIGVGLTQLVRIPHFLKKYALYTSSSFSGVPGSTAFSIALLVSGLIAGFILSYMYTRAYMAKALTNIDMEKIYEDIDAASKRFNQQELDEHAQTLVLRITGNSDTQIKQTDLNEAIKKASHNARTKIFYLARTFRKSAGDSTVDLVRPVFEALIDNDTQNRFFQNHAQNAYILKDRKTPDWPGALKAINRAIEIRDQRGITGYNVYELNRAILTIATDHDFKSGQKSSSDHTQKILRDLRTASYSFTSETSPVKSIKTGDETIHSWLTQNNLTAEDLK